MTQYKKLVEKARDKLKVEAWAKEIKMIYGERKDSDWVVTTTYNNGDEHIENVSKKTKLIIKSNMSFDDMLDQISREEADAIAWN